MDIEDDSNDGGDDGGKDGDGDACDGGDHFDEDMGNDSAQELPNGNLGKRF